MTGGSVEINGGISRSAGVERLLAIWVPPELVVDNVICQPWQPASFSEA
jgi:hypothetical protein